MYVNTNGNVTFERGLSTYTPGTITAGNSPIFAPFWADVDTRAGEVSAANSVDVDYSLSAYRMYLNNDEIYFNTLSITSAISNYDIINYNLSTQETFQESATELTGLDADTLNSIDLSSYYEFLKNAQNEISEQLGDSNYNTDGNSTGSNLVWYDLNTDTNTVTVTWDDVGYFSYNMDKTNAFQLQFSDLGDGEINISFIYEDINWTTGNASGGVNGLGGIIARAGYSAGDGTHYFELPTSGIQNAMLSLESFAANGVVNISMTEGVAQGIGLDDNDDTLIGSNFSDYLVGMGGNDYISAASGDDTLDGGEGNDTLDGGAGNDLFYTGVGTNIVYGGEGLDRVVYTNSLNDFDFSDMEDYFILNHDQMGIYDSLYDVETIEFGDIRISGNEIENLISLEEAVSRLYSALLGRTPDNDGLLYWLNDMNTNNTTVQNISAGFAGSEEYEARFGAQSNEEFINQLYNNILLRDADASGYDYWIDEISQTGDRTGMIVSFSNSEEYIQEQEEAIQEYLENVNLDAYIA